MTLLFSLDSLNLVKQSLKDRSVQLSLDLPHEVITRLGLRATYDFHEVVELLLAIFRQVTC